MISRYRNWSGTDSCSERVPPPVTSRGCRRMARSGRWQGWDCAISTTPRSIGTASCLLTTPTWNGISALRGIARRVSVMWLTEPSSVGAAFRGSGPSITSIHCRRSSTWVAAVRPELHSDTERSFPRGIRRLCSSPIGPTASCTRCI